MTSTNTSEEPIRICNKPGCGVAHSYSEGYHNRMVHQETVVIKHTGIETTVRRDNTTKNFICPTCSVYTNKDPERLRVGGSTVHIPILTFS